MATDFQRAFGYRIEDENLTELDEFGTAPDLVLASCKERFPNFDPYAEMWWQLQFQAQQNSCGGHAGCLAAQIMMGQGLKFPPLMSRASVYYPGQRLDGIHRDAGMTINAVRRILTEVGIVRESDWPYPSSYNPTPPPGYDEMARVKIGFSKNLRDVDLIWEMLRAGAAIVKGVRWNESHEQPLCNNYRRPGRRDGGHATCLYGLEPETDYAYDNNSWRRFMLQQQGRTRLTPDFVADILRYDPGSVFLALLPELDVDQTILDEAAAEYQPMDEIT